MFTVIPCLNPDGVVRGNYRSSFAGVDLNRQWILPSEFLHPTIYHTKKLLEETSKERSILLYCDLHGHSRKKNSFIYGCNRAANGGFNSWTKVRLLPRILARLNHVFDITSCKFKVEKGKLGTGRVVVWKDFGVTNSFTLENSFHGFDYGETFRQFTVGDLTNLGRDLLLSLSEYQKILVEIQKELNLTRGWLKPKRLLEVTGETAQEALRREARERKMVRHAASPSVADDKALAPDRVKGQLRPPRGPAVKARPGAKLSTQALLDQYVGNLLAAELSALKRKGSPKERAGLCLSSKSFGADAPDQASRCKALQTVMDSLVRIQAFVRMGLQRNRYYLLQAQKAEEEQQVEEGTAARH